ncbi:LOW QUALITY PROTEIN: hypothetical protein Dda_2123 [Drechslerella dactyloides]|uniref:Ubiquitin-like domain-containing protein n=1 Tax=Drechslerella dactyloides TaxID=74499 RepID=A0AAD6NM18_DREDA|nr:LOW QUALITY PROTEIN: hypothetical protein Dda_2123 [Drechslerella dactyloides]
MTNRFSPGSISTSNSPFAVCCTHSTSLSISSFVYPVTIIGHFVSSSRGNVSSHSAMLPGWLKPGWNSTKTSKYGSYGANVPVRCSVWKYSFALEILKRGAGRSKSMPNGLPGLRGGGGHSSEASPRAPTTNTRIGGGTCFWFLSVPSPPASAGWREYRVAAKLLSPSYLGDLSQRPHVVHRLELARVQKGVPIGKVDQRAFLLLEQLVLELRELPAGAQVVLVLVDLAKGIAHQHVVRVVVHPVVLAAVYRDPAVGTLEFDLVFADLMRHVDGADGALLDPPAQLSHVWQWGLRERVEEIVLCEGRQLEFRLRLRVPMRLFDEPDALLAALSVRHEWEARLRDLVDFIAVQEVEDRAEGPRCTGGRREWWAWRGTTRLSLAAQGRAFGGAAAQPARSIVRDRGGFIGRRGVLDHDLGGFRYRISRRGLIPNGGGLKSRKQNNIMASSAAAVPPEDEVRPFRIRVYRQGIVEQNPIAVEMSLSATVRDLKEKVKDVTSEPTDAQRLIHQGKQLEDDIGLREAFQYHLDDPNPITVHVVIRPPEEASSSSHPVRGFFHSSPSSSRQASGSTSAAASHAGPSRGHAASPLNPNLQPRGGAPQNDPAVNFNEEVTITTTSGSFFPNPNNRPGSTSSFRSGPPGGNGGPSQASRSANSSDSADNQHPPTHSTHTSSFAGTRSNGVYHRIVRTQTHTVRIRHQAHPGGTPSPPGGTAYSTGHSIGPSGTSFQGAHATPAGTSRAPSEPALGTPRAAAPGPRSESAGGTATFAFSNSNSPRADDANAFNTSALYENTNLTPNSFDVPNLPFGAAFPGMPSVDAASASLFGPPAIPEQQYWLLYSPDGPNSLLLSATPPPGPALPRRAPLGPVHLSPPPGWSLNEPLIDPPTLEPTGDLNAREAQLREQIEQTRTANLRRLAALNEQRRHLLDLQQQIANDMAGTQPQPAQQPLQPQAAQPQPQQVAQQQQPALQQLRRNPIEYILDTLAWFFGGNVDPAQPQQQQQQQREGIRNIANLVLDNAWLAVRLIFAVFILGGGRDTRRDLFLWLIFIIIFGTASLSSHRIPYPCLAAHLHEKANNG